MITKETGIVGQLVELDKYLSKSLSFAVSKTSPMGSYRPHLQFLEYSCHAVLWICGSVIGLWFSSTPEKEAVFFNLLLALILDITFIGVLKAAFHRKRPSYNDQTDMTIGLSVDKMSCPSGHTSRATCLTLLLMSSTSVCGIFHIIAFVWCFCTCASRVILGRHYVGDVLVGILLGCAENWLINEIWAGPETASWYLSFFKDSNSILIDDL